MVGRNWLETDWLKLRRFDPNWLEACFKLSKPEWFIVVEGFRVAFKRP